MLALELGSERACSIAIAAWQVGLQLDSQVGGWIAWAVSPTLKGATAATLPGRADTLRGKQRRTCSGSDAAWRTAVAGAFMLALGAREREAVKRAILWRAETAGEGEFARAVIWPMVDAKFGADVALPEFPGNFTTTSEVS
jgi:hypothetical protein